MIKKMPLYWALVLGGADSTRNIVSERKIR